VLQVADRLLKVRYGPVQILLPNHARGTASEIFVVCHGFLLRGLGFIP
jgi:hypothetical protein